MDLPLAVTLLHCPRDAGELAPAGDGLECRTCGVTYPVADGVVSFLSPDDLSAQDRREQASRDTESGWYDSMFEGYTNAVEVPTCLARLGRPSGPILDHGAGTGRIASALLHLGRPVVAVDYSGASLRRLMSRCAGGPAPVLAVQADLRRLPVRAGVISASTSIEVYEHFRAGDRRALLAELARVMAPGAVLAISTLSYNLVYRAWAALGNGAAKEGEHLLGGHFYYMRLTQQEFREELEAVFEVEELTGIRNVPARTIAGLVRRVGSEGAGDRFLSFMVERGHKVDVALERTPLAGLLGFFWLAKAVRRPGP